MLKKIVWGIIIAIMLGVIIIYLIKPGSVFSSDNIFNHLTDTAAKDDKSDSVDDTVTQQETPLEEYKVPEENTFYITDAVEAKGIQYKVNSYRVTKEKGDFLIEPYMKWTKEAQADENGELKGVYSYVIVNVTMENVSDTPNQVCVMNIGLQIRDQNGKSKYDVPGLDAEVKVFSGIESDKGMAASIFELDPGQKYEGELAFVETDEMLNDSKLELVIDPNGSMLMEQYEEIRRIRLN